MHRLNDPIYSRVSTNGFVLRINQDDFEVFVGRILIDPVRIQDPKVGAAAANTLFGSRPEGALVFELIDTLVGWLAYGE